LKLKKELQRERYLRSAACEIVEKAFISPPVGTKLKRQPQPFDNASVGLLPLPRRVPRTNNVGVFALHKDHWRVVLPFIILPQIGANVKRNVL
jgi:hypothetical protein